MSSPMRTVTTVMPVAKRPPTCRNARGSIPSLTGGSRRGGRGARGSGRFVLMEESADTLLQRLLVVEEIQGAHHPDGIAEEVALVEFLPTTEGGAGDVPCEAVEPHALLAAGSRRLEIFLYFRAERPGEIGLRRGRHQAGGA